MNDPSEVGDFLTTHLAPGHANRAFADAVVEHVAQGKGSAAEMAVAQQLVELLRPPYNSYPSGRLLQWPELLASLFQNADLLDPSDPGSARISELVMTALAIIDDGEPAAPTPGAAKQTERRE